MANNLLAALLSTASSNWGISEEGIQDAMARMAFHESKSDPKAIQLLDDGSYGRGRGLYQYEIDKDGAKGGAHTAIDRLLKFNEAQGNKYDVSFLNEIIKNKSYDFSQLEPDQQSMLFLADKLRDETANMGRYDTDGDKVLSNEELAGFHADEHWAGYGGVNDFLYFLTGGQSSSKVPSVMTDVEGDNLSNFIESISKREDFMKKIIEDYQFYKP